MESTFQNSVSDFDLDFLDHAPKKPLILNRVLKKSSVAYLKTKVLLTDSIVQKYNSSKDLLDETQKSLLDSQQECKNICIEYRNCLEKCNILENEILNKQNENKKLQDENFNVEIKYQGLKSHQNQLQVLITDYENQIKTLLEAAKLNKGTISSLEKKTSNQKKENDTLRKQICTLQDAINNKKTGNKRVRKILDKYKNVKKDPESISESEADDNSEHFEDATAIFFSEHSSDTIIIPQAPEPNKPTENKFVSIADEDTIIKRITSTESENNDGCSVDTGRGSSLAFSDGGKSFHSPDYYMDDSPLGSVIISSNKRSKSYKDGATSPMLKNKEYRNVSTSPIPTQKACRDRGTSPTPIYRRSVATSPVMFEKNHVYIIRDTVNRTDRGASPIKVLECFKPNVKNVKECRDTAVDTMTLVCETSTPRISAPREKECLEINNSLTINEDSRSDSEIQMILGEMKLHEQLITPIPSTPFKSSKARNLQTARNLSNIEESLFDKSETEGVALTKKIDAIFNMLSSIKEAMPYRFNSQIDVRKQQENTCDPRKESDANVLRNEMATLSGSTQNDSPNINEIRSDSELEEQRTSNRELTKNNKMATISESTQKDSSKINEVNSDSEHCVEFEDQQTSDNDLIYSKGHSESKTDNNDQLGQVPSQQTETINDDDESENLMTGFENERQIKDSNHIDIEFSKNFKYQDEVVDNVNRTIVLPKTQKRRKLTNLEKMRMRMVPKSKIKKPVPVRKVRVKPKLRKFRKITLQRKKICDSDTSASLNDKQVYENAVKVMTELKAKKSVRKFLTVVVEDCTKIKGKYANRTSSEVNIQNTVLDTILNSQAQICKRPAKSTDGCQNLSNYVNTTSAEIRRRAKRNTIDTIREPDETMRTLRPRRHSKGDNSSSDASDPSKRNKNVLDLDKSINSVEMSNIADIINSVELANKKIGKRKRQSTTSRQDLDTALNCNVSSDSEEKECKASPAKKITVIEEQNSVPATANQRILRSSVRQENEDKTSNVPSQLNNNSLSLLNGNSIVPNKRSPRISHCGVTTRRSSAETKLMINNDKTKLDINKDKIKLDMSKDKLPATNEVKKISDEHTKETAISYSDLDIFSIEPENTRQHSTGMISTEPLIQPKESVLCLMIEKYGTKSVHVYSKKPLESVTDKIHQKLEDEIEKINELHYNEGKTAMMNLVTEIQHWDIKDFIVGFMKYLKDPNRKNELFTAIVSPPAPPTTKSEQVLLYIISELRYHWENVDLVCDILNNMEYHLFCLNRTPDFNTIESMAHFYAVLCRYYRMSSRLRLFVLDALYCIQFKAVPLIKQCLDVWMHILPLAHMGIANTPLVTCLVYLLHFYKCEDRFNRIQDLRMILKRKYFYNVNDWNETKILDMLRTSIRDLRDIPVEIKMLRLALLIISKRQGPKWCLKNIITGILQPMIEKNNTSGKVKLFCISMLGPLLKPFPNDMKVHCEVTVNKLMDMLDLPHSQEMLEAIYSSLIHISKHNEVRLHKYLLKWNPPKISPEFEAVLRDYVKSKPIKVWKYALRNCLSSY